MDHEVIAITDKDARRGNEGKRWLDLLEVTGVVVCSPLVAFCAWGLLGDGLLWGQVAIWCGYLAAFGLIGLGLRMRGDGWGSLGLGVGRLGVKRGFRLVGWSVLVAVCALAAFVMGAIVMGMLMGVPSEADRSGFAYLRGDLLMLVVTLCSVYVVSSFGEELIFRGFMVTRLGEAMGGGRHGWVGAVAVSSVLFGLAHYAWGVAGVVQTGLMGGVLGAAYVMSGRRLWVVVLAHAYMDTLLIVPEYFG